LRDSEQPKFGNLLQTAAQDATKGFFGYLEKNGLAGLIVLDILGFNLPKISLCRTWKERLDCATLEASNTSVTLGASLTLPFLTRPLASAIAGVDGKYLGDAVPFAKTWATLAQGAAEKLGNAGPLAEGLKGLAQNIVGKAEHEVPEALAGKVAIARMAKDFGFYFPFAAAFWAAPFLRNWLTIHREGTANFEALIGLDQGNAFEHQRSPEEEKRFQLGKAKRTLAWGLGLSAASIVGLGLLARGATGPLKGAAKAFTEHYALRGPNGNQIDSRWSMFFFWSLPAYAGWIEAARSKNERIEQSVKAANSLFWFTFSKDLVKPFFKRTFLQENLLSHFQKKGIEVPEGLLNRPEFKLKSVTNMLGKAEMPDVPSYAFLEKTFAEHPQIRQELMGLKNNAELGQLAFAVLMLASMPQLLNIAWTRHRVQREQEAGLSPVAATLAQPTLSASTVSAPSLTPTPAPATGLGAFGNPLSMPSLSSLNPAWPQAPITRPTQPTLRPQASIVTLSPSPTTWPRPTIAAGGSSPLQSSAFSHSTFMTPSLLMPGTYPSAALPFQPVHPAPVLGAQQMPQPIRPTVTMPVTPAATTNFAMPAQ
jgi:hypothetical protein